MALLEATDCGQLFVEVQHSRAHTTFSHDVLTVAVGESLVMLFLPGPPVARKNFPRRC